jgi:hypothetical protein
MALRVVGAGLPRTGTFSLSRALPRLLGGSCYHMADLQLRPDHVDRWRAALAGEATDWDDLLAGYTAAVDWPAAACWRELTDAYPDAVVLLSERPAPAWWRSVDATVLEVVRRAPAEPEPWIALTRSLFERFCADPYSPGAAQAACAAHSAAVREAVVPDRLVTWVPGDGWEPLCAALGAPVPDEPFPHANTAESFRARNRLDR